MKRRAFLWLFGGLIAASAQSAGAQCVSQALSCPSRAVAGQINASDCVANGYYYDSFAFSGSAGDTIMITITSNSFEPEVGLATPNGSNAVLAFANGTQRRILYTLTESGTWYVSVNPANPGQTGSYNLLFSCGTPTSLNVNGGRYRITTRWTTTDGQSGEGKAVPLTEDTGYFWFFNDTNVEMVVKVLNGCGLNSRYWVFAAGLTNVDVVLTVTDTLTGAVKTYHNPLNTAFQPIQDTSAFATCQ